MRRAMVLVIASLIFNGCASAGQVRTPEPSRAAAVAKDVIPISLPNKQGSVRFAVIGDTGTGDSEQRQVGELMSRYREAFPFDFVLMLGDNMYGSESASAFQRKFSGPYKGMLDSGVKFYATLGNHDDANQRFYELFNMRGREFYTFKKGHVRFFALNSDYMDPAQLRWLNEEMDKSKSEWKICFFHHPLYSSGRKHGPHEELRRVLEPLFIKYGVAVVFSGHDHFYERFHPQQGVHYFVSGAGGKLRRDGIRKSNLTAKSFDQDQHFMLVEIDGDSMYFQVISRTGSTIDQGVLRHPRRASELT